MGIKRTIKKSSGSDLILLDDAFADFLTEKEARNLSPATLANYKTTYAIFCDFFGYGADTTTDSITLQDFYKWINTLRQDYKPTTINHYLRDMRCFCYWMMDDSRAYITPPFKIQMVEGQEEQLKFFTDDEISKLLEKPRKSDSYSTWRAWAITNWVLGTGNRAATVCDVKISDINFAKKEIQLGHTKNKKAQIIPLSSSLETAIKEFIRIWRKDSGIDSYLFCNVGEEKLTTNALRQAFGKYCNDRDVEKTNIHGLRHSFARGWVKANGNMFALQKILGHSSLDMTRKYVKLFSDDIKDDFDRFNPLDNIKRNGKRTQTIKRSL